MSKANDGGPAFPSTGNAPAQYSAEWVAIKETGMSLRDWFAGQALAGMLARPDFCLFPNGGDDLSDYRAAENAYLIADAMIARRLQP